MKISEMIEKLGLTVLSAPSDKETPVAGGYASDMLSDVIANAEKDCVWITIQTHANVIAVASLKDLAAVVITGGHEPEESTIDIAVKKNVCVLGTKKTTFETAGELYDAMK